MFKKRYLFYIPAVLSVAGIFWVLDISLDLSWWRYILNGAFLGCYVLFITATEKPKAKKIEITVTGRDCSASVLMEISSRLEEVMGAIDRKSTKS